MEIKKIVSFLCEENCWLISNNSEGILIDPGFDTEKILKECDGIKIPFILLTHCHYDHIKSLKKIIDLKKSKVVSTLECSENIGNKVTNASYLFESDEVFEPSDIILSDDEILNTSLGNIKCIKTPGHTNCGACYLIDNHLFSGDTLFKLSVGRWDLETGNEKILKDSIKDKIYILDDDIIVHPGHGEDSYIGYEKKYNLYVKAEK